MTNGIQDTFLAMPSSALLIGRKASPVETTGYHPGWSKGAENAATQMLRSNFTRIVSKLLINFT